MLILGYHRINPEAKDGLSVTSEAFSWQLEYLRDHGWENRSLEEVLSGDPLVSQGKCFTITIDDGYQDNYFHAFPILKRLGMQATIFVTTGFMDSRNPFPWVHPADGRDYEEEDLPLTWSQLAEMADSDVFTIGSHTLTHRLLSSLDRESACQEIEDSKEVLEQRFGHPVPLFCYPAGDFNAETIELVKQAGYSAAVVSPGRYIPETPFTLRRIGIDRDTTPFLFRFKISRFFTALDQTRVGWWLRGGLRSSYHKLGSLSTSPSSLSE